MFLWNLLFLAIQVIPICLFSFHPWIIVKKKWPLYRQFSVYLKSGPISRAVYGERGLIRVRVMVFNATFNNISVISW
jgi:hypothetical protein